MVKKILYILIVCLLVSCSMTPVECGYGLIVGKEASTDGRVYLAHNSCATGERMLNIYTVPPSDSSGKSLWFEFPGLSYSDTYLNGNGVGVAVVPSKYRYTRKERQKFYRIVHDVAITAPSASDGAGVVAGSIEDADCRVCAVIMFADCLEGWLCVSDGNGKIDVRRVPDDSTAYVRNSHVTGGPEIELTGEKHHRTDLCRSLIDVVPDDGMTLLSNVFCFDSRFEPSKGCCVYAGYPGQKYGSQTMFTPGTEVPDVCHQYATPEQAFEMHFSGILENCSTDHFYKKYLHPEQDINVAGHDYVVFVPTGVSDTFNDHFHVIDDPGRGLLYAFWTQGTYEGAADMHVAFSSSPDNGATWARPVVLAGPTSLDSPTPRAAWQQPMLSRGGRLYCLWNQETTSKNMLSGTLCGRYSDDGGRTWSEPEICPADLRSDTDDLAIPPVWCNWQRPLRLGEDGKFFVGSSRHGKAPYDSAACCKVEFWQYENIDDDPEIRDIRISIFSNGRNSLSADDIESEHRFVGSDGFAVEEASIVSLPDGRLFALMRSSTGHPVWSQSRDGGRAWDKPKVLKMSDGTPVLHPRSPCPMYDVIGPEARSCRYVAFVHNSFDFGGMSSYQLRGPLYRIDGVFDPDADQPVQFIPSGMFLPRETLNSMYSSYTPTDGGGILWFNDRKHYLFGKRIK